MRTDCTRAISLLVSDFVFVCAGRSISGGNLLDADFFHLKESALKSDPGMYNVRTVAGHTHTHTHTHTLTHTHTHTHSFSIPHFQVCFWLWHCKLSTHSLSKVYQIRDCHNVSR
jgi:hypothetical protein